LFAEFVFIGNLSAGGHRENPPTFTNIKSVNMAFISDAAPPVVIIAEDSCIRFITIDYEGDLSFGNRVGELLLFYIILYSTHAKLKSQNTWTTF